MKYRRDIDGIRAIAVLAVMAFHLGLQFVPGGFVGVDIFFVISGYLIGGIVLDGVKDGSFSLSNFYLRRFKRILPALTFVLLVVSIACLFILLPPDLSAYGKSLIAAALSVANIFFWRGTGYFDHSAVEKPLLHIWSLGVEEQFYAFFPLGALLLYRIRSSLLLPGMALVAALSLWLSVYSTAAKPEAAFYLLPGRTWELLVGVILAGSPKGWLKSAIARNFLAVAGLAAMLFAVFTYKVGTPFPGAAALLPCLGAVAVIAGGRDGSNIVEKALSFKPVVFIGLISFSLYLWHWPLIVLVQYAAPASKLSHLQQGLIFAGAMVLATLSWRFVEQPFRTMRAPSRLVFTYSALSALAVTAIGLVLLVSHGFPRRYSPDVISMANYLDYEPGQPFREHSCFLRTQDSIDQLTRSGCLRTQPGKANVLLLGNSHAAHLWEGLSQVDSRVNILQATASGWKCVPVIDRAITPASKCTQMFNYVMGDFLEKNRIDLVILSATWEEDEMSQLRATLADLKRRSIPVLLIGPGTQYAMPLPRLLAIGTRRKDAYLPTRFEEASPLRVGGQLRQIAAEEGADYISLHDFLCPDVCTTSVGSSPLLFDTDHYTTAGSALVAGSIAATASWKRMLSRFQQDTVRGPGGHEATTMRSAVPQVSTSSALP
ncbi:MAG TPA: acyltransferase family protein [Acidisarcina sp.]